MLQRSHYLRHQLPLESYFQTVAKAGDPTIATYCFPVDVQHAALI